MIANIIPVLNGRVSNGNSIRLGPHTTKIHRYLLVIFVAQSLQTFRLTYGEKIDNSTYFTLHGLGQVADKFKQFGPYHQPIHYDTTKVAGRIYAIISNDGLVAMRKKDGQTYVTITEDGNNKSSTLLQELIAFEELANLNTKTNSEDGFIAKGTKSGTLGSDLGLQKVQKRLAEGISEINLQFEDELETIDDEY